MRARASERPSLSCASKRREHTRCAQRERCTTCNTAHTHAQGGPEPDRKDDRNTAAADGRNKQVEWRPPRRSQLEPDAMLTEPTHSCLPGPGCLSPRLPLPRFSCARSRAARGRVAATPQNVALSQPQRSERGAASPSPSPAPRRIQSTRAAARSFGDSVTTRRLGQI